ncbi:MAG: MFS transporter, partial [Sorangium cellulosum]
MPTPTKKKRLSLNKVLALLLLYSVQGIPFGFFLFTFPLHLRGQGMGLGKITFLSIVNLPWLVKFLWAPLVDKYWFPRLGRRKSWIWPAQGFLIVALVVTGLLVSRLSLVGFLVALTVINLFASTQDIAVDGLAVDILEEWERGMGNAIQAAAFKIGMLGGGFGLTFVLSYYSIATCFYLMAAAVFVVSLAPFLVREPPPIGEEAAASGRQVILGLLTTWFRRPGTLVFLAFLLFAKAGDALA